MKSAARQLFADRLRAGRLQLHHDLTRTAAKNNTKEERQDTINESEMETSSASKARLPHMKLAVFATCCCKSSATCAPELDYHAEYKYYYDEIAKCSWFSGGIRDALTIGATQRDQREA
eukprot:725990-Pyramimonas_sp.AAC.1